MTQMARLSDAALRAEYGTQLELYLKEVQLHPVSVRVSVQMGMACDEAELQEWHPTNSLVGLARHLVSLLASSPTSP